MRDPARINRMVSLLRAYWLAHPDMRLGQILGNMTRVKTPLCPGSRHFHESPGDPYYVEDDVIEAALRRAVEG